MPAFLAPLRATVATGTPPGICSIDKTESQPSMELIDFIGTPMTGRGDNAAIIPGRWAAPPAPAMIALSLFGGLDSHSPSFSLECGGRRRCLPLFRFKVFEDIYCFLHDRQVRFAAHYDSYFSHIIC